MSRPLSTPMPSTASRMERAFPTSDSEEVDRWR
jgi:hypothetical protein